MRFTKWEGLGNDFVVVTDELTTEQVQRICHRRRGIGADGVLWLSFVAEQPRMVVLNADGSRPEMCGNGLRCVVGHYAAERHSNEGEVHVLTDSGSLHCRYRRSSAGYDVTCDMGPVSVAGTLDFGGLRFREVRVGNPHLVTFDDFQPSDFERLGRALQTEVPGGVNVEFCSLEQSRIRVKVWERGVGPTEACGTGACAVAAAAAEDKLVVANQPVDVALPGGVLRITVEDNGRATMEGPARCVFAGDWNPD